MEITTNRDKINDIFNHMYDQNDYILDKLFDDDFNGTLNLSNFNRRFHLQLSFNKKGVLDNCERCPNFIKFKNNKFNSLVAFKPSRKISPNLETIIVEGNPISDNSFIFNEITATGVYIQQSIGGFVNHKISKPPNPFAHQIELPPPDLATDKKEGRPIEILPSEYITNSFLIAFLKQSLENMCLIAKFYGESAIMSVTSESSTDLLSYQPFTRNLKNGRDNFVQGPEEITEFCLSIFGNSVDFKITKIQANKVVESGHLMVLHGSFVD